MLIFEAMKLTEETIGVNTKDLEIFLRLLVAFAGDRKEPYLCDASNTILDVFFNEDEPLKSEFEIWSNGQIKFK